MTSPSPLTIFILAGWGRLPSDGGYFKPLIDSLRKSGARVIPAIESCADGDINKHVNNLRILVESSSSTPLTQNTFFLGQSIGNQIIARYLASLPSDTIIGGWIAIAGWFHLDRHSSKPRPSWTEGFYQTHWQNLLPWTNVDTINLNNLRSVCPRVLALLGSDDYLVGQDDDGKANASDWRNNVNAEVHVRAGRAHYFHLTELPKEELNDIFGFLKILV